MKKISVVTVNHGDIRPLIKTIKSVDGQTVNVFEHIVVASGVSECDKEMLNDYIARYRFFYINQDNSLYNAMNIGLASAKGDFVFFLNGGDEFYNEDVTNCVTSVLEDGKCGIFCTLQKYNEDKYVRVPKEKLAILLQSPGHQGFFAPISDNKIFYDESISIAADSKWMKEYILSCGATLHSAIVATFFMGGVSNYPSKKTVMARFRSQGKKRAIIEAIKWCLRVLVGSEFYYRILMWRNGFNKMQ